MKRLLLTIALCISFMVATIVASTAETFAVPSTTSAQTVWVAPSTGTYQITVSGLWLNGGWLETDAAGYANRQDVGWITEHKFAGVDKGECSLLINYKFVDWGDLNQDHVYKTTCVVSKGDTLGFSVADTYPFVDSRHGQVMDWYFDNLGYLIVCVTPTPGLSLSGFCGLNELGTLKQ